MSNNDLASELIGIKNQIDRSKAQLNKIEGKLETSMDSLKELGCKTVGEAEKKIKKLNELVSQRETAIETGVSLIKELGLYDE